VAESGSSVVEHQYMIAFPALLFVAWLALLSSPESASPLITGPSDSGHDWPSQRGDLGRRGRSPESIDTGRLTMAWSWSSRQAPAPAWPGPARWDAFAKLAGLKAMRNYDPVFHVSAGGESIYFGSSSDDAVRCLDAATGEERWVFHAGGPVRVAPTLADEHLYFGSDDGAAYCLDAASGELRWRAHPVEGGRRILSNGRVISAWPVRTGVHVQGGVAYFGASLLPWRSSYLCAVDAKRGVGTRSKSHYVRDLGTGWSLEGALLLSEESVIVPQGRVAPLVFERATGEPQGTLAGGGGSFCLLTDDDQILHGPGNKDGWITASAANSRAKLASYARGNAIVVEGETAYMLSDKRLAAMDRSSQALLWTRAIDTPYELILAGDTLFCGGDGKVEARSKVSGDLLWRAEVPGRAWGLAVARGRLIVSTDAGHVIAFHEGDEQDAAPEEVMVQEAGQELGPAPKLTKVGRPSALIDRWVFQADQQLEAPLAEGDPRTVQVFRNHGDGRDLRPQGRAKLVQAGALQALVWDGVQGDIEVVADFHGVEHPKKQMSAEAWVRIDESRAWGGLIGMAQDNGAYERGWMLGFRDRRFGLALAGEKGSGRLTWLLAPEDYQLGTWHQVVGTYDGKTMRLFVDGEEVATSRAEAGNIAYPETAYYQVGAYRDADEYFRVKGLVAELALYDVAIPKRVIEKHWKARAELLPEPVTIKPKTKDEPQVGPTVALPTAPSLRFVAPGEAVVRWETAAEEVTRLELTPEGGVARVIERPGRRRVHELRLTELHDKTVYDCVVLLGTGAGARRSRTFECDTHFDLFHGRGEVADAADEIRALIKLWRERSPVTKGIAVVLGSSGDEQEAAWLEGLSREMHGLILVTSDSELDELRRKLAARGDYGARISCVGVPDKGSLELPLRFANLLISNPRAPQEARELLARDGYDLVRPDGGVAILIGGAEPGAREGFEPWIAAGGDAYVARRAPIPGAADWTHMYGRPDNSAYTGETLSGASDTAGLELSWIGRPGPRYQTDRQNRKPAPLSTAGRLFLQGLNRVLAVDGYNGTLLWDLGLAGLQRFNIPRSSSNWCADRDRLFLAMGERLHVIDASTGDPRETFPVHVPKALEQRAPQIAWEWGYVAQVGELCFGSAVRAGGQFTEWWGGENWFDSKSGEHAKKVCNEAVFALDKASGEVRWSRSVGRVVEPTIAMSDGRMVFAECRNPAALAIGSARIGDELWQDLWLVCLDARTGDLIWEREAKPLPGSVAFYLAVGEGTIVMVSSGLHVAPGAEAAVGQYAVYAFDLEGGKSTWRKKIGWEADHHGKHLSRPAISEGQLFLRPVTFELATGRELSNAFPVGHQCGSYACSRDAVFLRAGDMTVWDRESGGASRWRRLRPDCWISTIPAGGMLLSPEGGGGCSCGSWIQASMGFVPRRER
jgi:outer membrane protein assembly factor BamB